MRGEGEDKVDVDDEDNVDNDNKGTRVRLQTFPKSLAGWFMDCWSQVAVGLFCC